MVYLRTGRPRQGTKRECTRAAEQVGVGLAGCAKLENLGWRRFGEQEGRRDSGVLKGTGRKQRRNSPGLRPKGPRLRPKREAWNPWWMRSRVIRQNPGEPGKQNDYLIASPDLRVDALSPIACTGQDTCKNILHLTQSLRWHRCHFTEERAKAQRGLVTLSMSYRCRVAEKDPCSSLR